MPSATGSVALNPRRNQIETALDCLRADQRTHDFQRLAVALARRRWPELRATELLPDGGEDATPSGPGADGLWRRVGVSLTATFAKIRQDAARQQERGLKTDVLVFITPAQVRNLEIQDWKAAFRTEFGHELEVWSREELVHLLLEPDHDILAQTWLDLEPAVGAPQAYARVVATLRPYLEFLTAQCQRLNLLGIDPKARENPLTLDAVYTALDTKSAVPGHRKESNEPKVLSALAAIGLHPQVVLKGDPGSGKSTLLNHLALCLARHALAPDGPWLNRLTDWTLGGQWLPLTVVLRDLVRDLGDHPPPATMGLLWDFVVKSLTENRLAACAAPLELEADTGRLIVFFDGLDEVPTDAQRTFVHQLVNRFRDRYPRARLVITCRTLPYEAMKLERVADYELAPFDDARIAAFIAAWYGAQVPVPFTELEAATRKEELTLAIHRPELRRLAGNPLLLTDMALLHTHRGRLPDDRGKLYQEIIDLLLLRWEETRQMRRLQDLLRAGERDVNDLLRTLGSVAYAVHERSRNLRGDQTGDIPAADLLLALQKLHPKQDWGWVQQVIATIRERAGLLIARTESTVFAFPHRSFQEYLAAYHLIKEKDFARKAVELLDETGYWREVILWTAAQARLTDEVLEFRGFGLLRKLTEESARGKALWWHRVWLAGEVLAELGRAKVEQFDEGRDLAERVRRELVTLIEQGHLSPRERLQAGMALGRIGDPRPGVGVVGGKPDIAWRRIPAGPFEMGDGEERHTCTVLTADYEISEYPVTVAQYGLFVAAGGYDQAQWWTADGWAWRSESQIRGPKRNRPEFEVGNHPQVGVSWYEAVAYAAWVGAQLGRRVQLASEAEWERAARGTTGREYPWDAARVKGEPAEHCNIGETGLEQTSAVGLFPTGRAECGAADMAGNVWEWTRSLWGSDYGEASFVYPYRDPAERELLAAPANVARVLRGGSWSYDAHFARCSIRNRRGPRYRLRDFGFRLVASP